MSTRPEVARRPQHRPPNAVLRAVVGWLESAAALSPDAAAVALACCGPDAVAARRPRRSFDGHIAK